MTEDIRVLRGGNMDIDLIPMPTLDWERDECPWNKAVESGEHRCAVKNTSICRYFRGIQPLDTVLCAFPSTDPKE
jgi:hypothetical protein